MILAIKSVPMMLRSIRNKDFYAGSRIISCNFALMNRVLTTGYGLHVSISVTLSFFATKSFNCFEKYGT